MNKKITNFLKNRNNIIIITILIIGTLFMLIPATDNKEAEKKPFTEEEHNSEEELKFILSKIKGVGDVEVMITYKASSEKRLAYETRTNKSDRGDSGYDESAEKQAVMSEGEPVVLSRSYPTVKGVVVIAEGAANSKVRSDILEAVVTAFDIASHKVCILEK